MTDTSHYSAKNNAALVAGLCIVVEVFPGHE